MSKSGIPVVSQIGSGVSAVGSAIGSFLNPKMPDAATPPTTPNPATDSATADAMQKSEEEQQQKVKGEAANFLTMGGGAGLSPSSSMSTSRAVLLGS